jgi:hypothetical protein
MCTITAHFSFNKCPSYTHDGASAKFSTISHEKITVQRERRWTYRADSCRGKVASDQVQTTSKSKGLFQYIPSTSPPHVYPKLKAFLSELFLIIHKITIFELSAGRQNKREDGSCRGCCGVGARGRRLHTRVNEPGQVQRYFQRKGISLLE